MRGDWAKTWAKLITKGGELVTLIFPDKPSKEGGPPFHSSPDDVRQLLEDNGKGHIYQIFQHIRIMTGIWDSKSYLVFSQYI